MEEGILRFAMCGSSESIDPYEVTRPVRRQRILMLINQASLKAEEIAERLGLSLEEVERDLAALREAGLIKEVRGRFSPNFAIFTLRDYEILGPLLKELSVGIKEIVERRLGEVRALIKELECARRGLDFPDLEYIVVGAITLDYEALGVLRDEGLIVLGKEMPGGGRYVFAGFEWPIELEKAWMWGHNAVTSRGYWFSTHGRLPPKGPRMAFPDLAWVWMMYVRRDEAVKRLDMIGEALELLSREDLSVRELSEKTGRSESELLLELSLLWALGYVVPILTEGKWRIDRPFFTAEDLGKVKDLSRSILSEVVKFFENRLPKLREAYAQTSPWRNGVPFEEAFTQLYHVVFEEALNVLIEDKILCEPPLRIDGGKYSPFIGRGNNDSF